MSSIVVYGCEDSAGSLRPCTVPALHAILMRMHDVHDDQSVVSPSGTRYTLADDSMPLSDQAQYNYQVTNDYLRDVLEHAVADGPPEAAPILVGHAMSKMLRSMPVPWLREFAYAGILRRAESLSDEVLDGILPDTDASIHGTIS